jgi:hypothetical protein
LSFLTLHGIPGENGTYACRLSNSRHETFKHFTVKFAEDQLPTIIISVVIVLAVVLIAAIGISIKFYRDKVNIQYNSSIHYNLIFIIQLVTSVATDIPTELVFWSGSSTQRKS